jgi:hypothetical protein
MDEYHEFFSSFLVPTVPVGMPSWTLCVLGAERRHLHSTQSVERVVRKFLGEWAPFVMIFSPTSGKLTGIEIGQHAQQID